jgi:stalled ribosome rescue protein Dom34
VKALHSKRQQMNEAYYKEIAAVILKYDNVILFGPTNAKTELHSVWSEIQQN